MKVFLTGATGVLGHRLVERLADRGHEVYGLVRDDEGAALVTARGGVPRRGDVLDRDSLERAIPDTDLDAVVHAATAIPTAKKPSEEDWGRNDRVRREGIRNLLAVAGDSVDRVLFPSVVWVARQPDGSHFDETADRHPDRTTQSAAAVEDILQNASSDYGFDPVILRCGFFYAPDAAHTRQFGQSLLDGSMPIIGGGLLGQQDGTLSFIHADDAARAIADTIDAEIDGWYHVVDDQPTTFAAFLSTFADRLETSAPRRLPGWIARWIVGSETVDLLTKSMPTTNDRFRADVDWEPTYPTVREGLSQVHDTWKNDGTLAETETGYEWAGE